MVPEISWRVSSLSDDRYAERYTQLFGIGYSENRGDASFDLYNNFLIAIFKFIHFVTFILGFYFILNNNLYSMRLRVLILVIFYILIIYLIYYNIKL